MIWKQQQKKNLRLEEDLWCEAPLTLALLEFNDENGDDIVEQIQISPRQHREESFRGSDTILEQNTDGSKNGFKR